MASFLTAPPLFLINPRRPLPLSFRRHPPLPGQHRGRTGEHRHPVCHLITGRPGDPKRAHFLTYITAHPPLEAACRQIQPALQLPASHFFPPPLPPLFVRDPSTIRPVSAMPRGTQLQPLELAPEWLTNSPVTADDFRCLTPASTIFRMSFGARSHSNPRESVVSMESDDAESDGSTFLWGDESESEDDADTIEEPEPTPVARPEPSPQPQSLPTPAHSRAPSTESVGKRQDRAVDFRLPWFMQVDPVCLTSLDDQLLQSPLDAFADLCYAQAVRASDIPTGEAQAGHSYGYSWRRLSRLLSACPDVTQAALGLESNQGSDPERERESESDSDTDSEQLASPEQHAPAPSWGLSVYQPKSEREQSESPYRPYTSQTLIAKPLPALPTYEPVPEPPRTPPSCSPPPLRPSDAVAQAQLAFLFAGSPPRAGESVHFFPTKEQQGPPPKRGRSRRGTLHISTDDGGSGGGGGGTAPWSPRLGIFQRGLAGLRAGLSH